MFPGFRHIAQTIIRKAGLHFTVLLIAMTCAWFAHASSDPFVDIPLFGFGSTESFLEEPFDVLSNGERIDMYSGGLVISKTDIQIPGRLSRDLAIGHTYATETVELSTLGVEHENSYRIAFDGHAAHAVSESIQSTQDYVPAYDAEPVQHDLLLDPLAPLGVLTYETNATENVLRWKPSASDGMYLWWGEYAGIIIMTQIYPYAPKEEDDSEKPLQGKRIAYLVHNDGRLELFDHKGMNVSGHPQGDGVMRYYHGSDSVGDQPYAECADPDIQGYSVDCSERRNVQWHDDAVDGVEYVSSDGNVYAFEGKEGYLLTVGVRRLDACYAGSGTCMNGMDARYDGQDAFSGQNSPLSTETKIVHARNIPFFRIDSYRLVSTQDAFGNKRTYEYADDNRSLEIQDHLGVADEGLSRNVSISKNMLAWSVHGPTFSGEGTASPINRYFLNDQGKIVRHANGANESTHFSYQVESSSLPVQTPLAFSHGPNKDDVGGMRAFFEAQYPTNAVLRYEQYEKTGDPNEKKRTSRTVFVTAWPNASDETVFQQRMVVIDPAWEDLQDIHRASITFETSGVERAHLFEQKNDVPVLKKIASRVGGSPKFRIEPYKESNASYRETTFDYAWGVRTDNDGKQWFVRGPKTQNIRYENQNFILDSTYDKATISRHPTLIKRPDGSQTQFSYPGATTFTYRSPMTEEEVQITFEDSTQPGERIDLFTDANGIQHQRRTEYAWGGADACGNLLSNTVLARVRTSDGGDAMVTAFCYDAQGNVTEKRRSYEDGSGVHDQESILFGYDEKRLFPTENTVAEASWLFEYDDSGHLRREENPNGAWKSYHYDGAGRLHRVLYGTNGSFREYAYSMTRKDDTGLQTILQPEVVVTRFDQVRAQTTETQRHLDGFGRIVREIGDGVDRQYTYNDRGKIQRVKEGEASAVYHYDVHDRLSAITRSDTGTVQFTYDAVNIGSEGAQTTSLRQAAHVGAVNLRNRYFNIAGKLLRDERMLPSGPLAVDYSYDALGRRIKKKTPAGRASTWVVDGLSRTVSASLSTGVSMQVEQWAPNGRAAAIVFDGTDQRQSFNYHQVWNDVAAVALGGSGVPYDVTYAYDAEEDARNGKGRLTNIDDPLGQTDFTYTPSGSLAFFERTIDELDTTYRIGMVQDVNGKPYRLTYADGRSVYYMTDAQGRVSEIRLMRIDGPIVASLSYDDRGRVERIDYGNGTATIYRYVGDLLVEVFTQKGAEEYYHEELTYDQRGRRIEAIYHDSSRVTYAYDDADRLTKAAYYKANESEPHAVQRYAYDADGNRISSSDAFKTLSYTYDPQTGFLLRAEYSDGEGWRYDYDDFGRLIQRRHFRNGVLTQGQRFQWNNAGHLIQVETLDSDGAVQAIHEYAYDSLGRREKRLRSGVASYALYGESLDPLSRMNAAGEVERDYIYFSGYRLAAIDGERIDYYHVNESGSTLLTTDERGKVTGGYRYDPFGNVLFSIADDQNAYRFAGKHYDDETGFLYFGGRYYDPTVGRFISPDPAGEGVNPYSFLSNNPFGAQDVFGWFSLGGGPIGGGMGGGGMDGPVDIGGAGDFFNDSLGGGGLMDGPSMSVSPFVGIIAGFLFNLPSFVGVDLSIDQPNPLEHPFLFGMGAEERRCEEGECDDGEEDDEALLDELNRDDSIGLSATGDGDSNEWWRLGGLDFSGDDDLEGDDSGGNGPAIDDAPATTANEDGNWAENNPADDTGYDLSDQVEKDIDEALGVGDEGKSETAGGLLKQDDMGDKSSQDRAANGDPTVVDRTDPIMLHNGEVLHVERALKVPGRGIDFEFVRTYRSRIEYDGPMGYNWDHSFNKRLLRVDAAYCEEHPLDACCAGVEWEEKPEGYAACYIRFDGRARYDAYTYHDEGGYFEAPLGFFDRLRVQPDGSVVIRDREGLVHRYGADGFCTAIEDRFGNRIALEYEGEGAEKRLSRVIDTLGRAIAFRYADGRLVEVEDFSGRRVQFAYDASHNLIEAREPATPAAPSGATMTYAYSSGFSEDKEMLNHNLLSITDALGQTFTVFAYSFTDRVVWHRFGEEAFTIQSTMMGAWPVCETQEEVDRVASRTRLTDRNGNERLFEYNCQGNALAVHAFTRGLRDGDPEAYVTRYTYDLNGQMTSEQRPAGNRVETTYQAMESGDPTVDRLFAANAVRVRRVPDAARGGDVIETERRFEPLAMQVLSETTDGVTKTWWYAYQEGASLAQLGAAMDISSNTAAVIFADLPLGQGDLNGDGQVDSIQASLVRLDEPIAHDRNGQAQEAHLLFAHNEHGQMTRKTDPTGLVTAYAYYASGDSRGYPETQLVDPDGLSLRTHYAYDSVGNQTQVVDAAGSVLQQEYDAMGHPIETVDPTGAVTKRSYDAEGNLVRIDRPGSVEEGDLWVTTRLTYNALNRPVLREGEVSADRFVVTEYRYDGNENRTRVIRPMGNSTLTEYDERDLVLRVRRGFDSPEESVERYRYDANGNKVAMVDGAGARTEYVYDGHDRLVETIDPVGSRTRLTYDAFDRVVREERFGAPEPDSDPETLLAQKERVYDERGRVLIEREYAVANSIAGDSRETTFSYDAASRLIETIDPLGAIATVAYDSAGRVSVERDAVGNEVRTLRDGMGRPTEIAQGEIDEVSGATVERTTRIAYDVAGRMVSREDDMGQTERFAYDGRGNRIWQADAEGRVTLQRFDGLDRPTVEIRQGGVETTTIYNDNGDVVALIDAKGNRTDFAYDALDRRVRTVLPDGAAYAVEYDGASRPVRRVDPRGVEERKSYDGAGHLLARRAWQEGNLLREDAFRYDGLGRMREAESRDGAGLLISHLEEGFDPYGRNDVSLQDGRRVDRAFNAQDRLTSLTTPDGIAVSYTRDAIGRIDTVAEATAGLIAQFDHVGGRRAQARLGNQLTASYAYDAIARPIQKWVEAPGGAHPFDLAAVYDGVGNRLSEIDRHAGDYERRYQYDDLDRLTEATLGSERIAYDLDPLDNITARTRYRDPNDPALTDLTTYTVDALNQYPELSLSIDGGDGVATTLVYDAAGNLIDDGVQRYVYDDRNLLIEVRNHDDDTLIVQYAYDALKRRIAVIHADGRIVEYLYDGWQVVQEYEDGIFVNGYVLDDTIDNPIAMLRDGETFFYQTDFNRNVRMLTDELGQVAERYSYDPYGTVTITDADGIELESSAIGNAYLFSSRRYDEEAGFYYYRNRMYSSELGRFMQRDPIWYDDGMNLYAYVGGNPVNRDDPMGLFMFPIMITPDAFDNPEIYATDTPGYISFDIGHNFEVRFETSVSLGLVNYSSDSTLSYITPSFGAGLDVTVRRKGVEPIASYQIGEGRNFSIGISIGESNEEPVLGGINLSIGPSFGFPHQVALQEKSLYGSTNMNFEDVAVMLMQQSNRSTHVECGQGDDRHPKKGR